MKLKKLFAMEIAVALVVLIVVLVVVEITPYLATSKADSKIAVYDEKTFATGSVTLGVGQTANAQFNYSTYDPAILVVDLTFQDWQIPGQISMYCNGRLIAAIYATPSHPSVHLTTISVSGWDWVKPPSVNAYTYGNEVTFVSEPQSGYQGTFNYKIDIRGSR